jgi:hypothetical protein
MSTPGRPEGEFWSAQHEGTPMSTPGSFSGWVGAARVLGQSRQAALLLRTVDAADRQWLLARLPDAHRRLLQRLQVELDALGLPADPELLHEVLRNATAAAPVRTDVPGPAGIEQTLAEADPALIAQALSDEPAALVARLLALHDWPWAQALLAALGHEKRRQVMARTREAAASLDEPAGTRSIVRTRFDEQLLSMLVARLERLDPDRIDALPSSAAAGAPARPRWWQRGPLRGAHPTRPGAQR